MDALGESAEVANALKFVIGQFDVEMLLDPREQIERLQAVYAESLEEIVAGVELLARNFEMLAPRAAGFRLLYFPVWALRYSAISSEYLLADIIKELG